MRYFEFVVTGALLVLAAVYKSPAFGYAAVLSLFANMAREAMETKLFALKDINIKLPEDVAKKIENLEIRTTSIEMGIRARGF